MCNEAARRTALGLMRDDFRQVRIELSFPEGLPNLGEAPSIRITDSTVIVRAAGDAVEMVQRRWSWVGPQGKPVYNYRSEGRRFDNSASSGVAAEGGSGQGRCLIPLDGFYEFTDAAHPLSLAAMPPGPPPQGGRVKKDKWLFTLPECALFCVAGLWRGGVEIGSRAAGPATGEAWTMLTCAPGPDIAPYHNRQVVIMPRDRWADWLAGEVPAADLIAPTPAGTLRVVAATPPPATPR